MFFFNESYLIVKSHVAGNLWIQLKETECTESIVECYNNKIAIGRQHAAFSKMK